MAIPGVGPAPVDARAGSPLASDPGAASAVFVQCESIVLRRIAGEHLLVPIRHQLSQMRAIFAVTGTGVWIG